MKSTKVEGRTPVKLKRTNGAKRGFIVLSVSLGLAACVPLLDTYIVRELLLFVACAALFVFFAANLALLGILFHAAGRSLLHSVRKARPGITQQEEPMGNSVLSARGTKRMFAG